MSAELLDVVVVGAGPAGLSAALVLGRCCRTVLVVDSGRPRNDASSGVHGFLTRDGIPPGDLRRIGREQLRRYGTVELRDGTVTAARCDGTGFLVVLADGTEIRSRKLLLATGVVDEIPPIAGMRENWGRGVYPCPYCDAWEVRDKRLGVYGSGDGALSLCRALTAWTTDIVLFTDGPSRLGEGEKEALERKRISVVRERVLAVEGEGDTIARVVVEGRPPIERDALFVSVVQRLRSPLIQAFGCELNEKGRVATGEHEATNVPGLFVAGDASPNVQFAIVAAAEGAEAAFAINRALVREDFGGGGA